MSGISSASGQVSTNSCTISKRGPSNFPGLASRADALVKCVGSVPCATLRESVTDFNWFDVPNVFGVLFDGAVATELAGSEGVVDRHFGPLGLVLVYLVNVLLFFDVSLEVSADKVPIIVVSDSAYEAHQ